MTPVVLALLSAVSWPTLNEFDQFRYDRIFAPTVTGSPVTYDYQTIRDLTVTESGAIRHYGEETVDGRRFRVYSESLDLGLTWRVHQQVPGDAGAMVKSPVSGDWLSLQAEAWHGPFYLVRSKRGPGFAPDSREKFGYMNVHHYRQPRYMPKNKVWLVTSGASDGYLLSLRSEDDGRTWERVELTNKVSTAGLLVGFDKSPRWDNFCCEPSAFEARNGTIYLIARTAFDHPYLYRSRDGGKSWAGPVEVPYFWMSNTMPTYHPLSDGRLLFFWNNAQPLPKRDPAEYPELFDSERKGRFETVFTNRDVLHCAISEDDGRTWIGFRELTKNVLINRGDLREQGNLPPVENDKSVHQEQALELPGGKVLVALGQNSVARQFVLFDPKWLYETERTETFRYGKDGVATYLFVRSLNGNQRDWAGHCAFNRVEGAVMMREPDTGAKTVREALNLARIPDARLVTDRQGLAWNFPTQRKGFVELDCRLEGKEFSLALSDHFLTPSDELNFAVQPAVFRVLPSDVGAKKWLTVRVDWDCDAKTARLSADGRAVATSALADAPRFGFSYLHLRATEEPEDQKGTYFREFRMKGTK